MSGHALASHVRRALPPIGVPAEITILPGPALLATGLDEPSLAGHRRHCPEPEQYSVLELAELARRVRLRGRGGAGFPFSTKLQTVAAADGRAVVVVNLSEGEPASAKDTALAIARPHLILDGAMVAAQALGTREIHIALPGERPLVTSSINRAVAERADRIRWRTHVGARTFVAGQASAVIELIGGRTNRPVTTVAPEAVSGHRGRPTLLSNAETWAQLAQLVAFGASAYVARGLPNEPGTTLLTITTPTGPGGPTILPTVVEVEYGSSWADVLPASVRGWPLLVGGFHGNWISGSKLAATTISINSLRSVGATLGAGAVILPGTTCPVVTTSKITDYLADQSARACGPCLNGLPRLARALRSLARGESGGDDETRRLIDLVVGRGACSHPDGTARLITSMIREFPRELAIHATGACSSPAREPV
ncbi:MAG: NADH-ubiquinone oxidoreductase-F iron-sulfur binding region domain-containing protein [Nocardioides sp.]